MGMPIGIEAPGDVDPEPAFRFLREADALFSTFRSDSDICRLQRGEITLADCHPAVVDVLSRCAALGQQTGGAFSARPRGLLDPSAYVKGWAVDRAAALLDADSFCINASGDVLVRGRPAPGQCWRIGIRHPVELEQLAAVVDVCDLAVATSGEYEQGAHIVDPRTGLRPAGVLSVTVIGPELATADAYATAAFAMGADGPAWLASLDDFDALCIMSDHRVLCTPGFGRHRV